MKIKILKQVFFWIRKNYHWLIIGVMILAYYLWGYSYEVSKKEFTKGVLVEIGKSMIKAKYQIDASEYETSIKLGPIARQSYIGETFVVAYSSNDPTLSRIRLEMPFIYADSLYEVTPSIEYSFSKSYSLFGFTKTYVNYSYLFNNVIYSRMQLVEGDFENYEKEKLTVLVLKSEPRISYVCVDKRNCWIKSIENISPSSRWSQSYF